MLMSENGAYRKKTREFRNMNDKKSFLISDLKNKYKYRKNMSFIIFKALLVYYYFF